MERPDLHVLPEYAIGVSVGDGKNTPAVIQAAFHTHCGTCHVAHMGVHRLVSSFDCSKLLKRLDNLLCDKVSALKGKMIIVEVKRFSIFASKATVIIT